MKLGFASQRRLLQVLTKTVQIKAEASDLIKMLNPCLVRIGGLMTQGGLVVGSLDICAQRNIILTLDLICLAREEKSCFLIKILHLCNTIVNKDQLLVFVRLFLKLSVI